MFDTLTERRPLPDNLQETNYLVDEVWERVYDQAVAEVKTGRQPSWAANARYMILLKHQAYLQGDRRRVGVLRETLDGLREREQRGDTQPLGPVRRSRVSDIDSLFAGFELVRKLRALIDAQQGVNNG